MTRNFPRLRLGVNIDHVATLRNARGGAHPDPLRAATTAIAAGADGITAHLREDRRHVNDRDLQALIDANLPVNFEMAATPEMERIALDLRPLACCIVPERRQERTTEGGLDVVGNQAQLRSVVAALNDAGIATSLFIEPNSRQLAAAHAIGARIVELHTGAYCNAVEVGEPDNERRFLDALRSAAGEAAAMGIEVHAGHGLGYSTIAQVAGIAEIIELQIGHFLVGEAVFVGLETAIRNMRKRMDDAR